MNITRFRISNKNPEKISFPNERNLDLSLRLEWSDPNIETINFKVVYSVIGNNSNIKFQNFKDVLEINYNAPINALTIEETLSFIKSGTIANPASQFTLTATVNINGTMETDLILVNIN